MARTDALYFVTIQRQHGTIPAHDNDKVPSVREQQNTSAHIDG